MIHPESSLAAATLRAPRADAMRIAGHADRCIMHTQRATTILLKPSNAPSRACYSPIILPIDTYSLPSKRINCIASIGA